MTHRFIRLDLYVSVSFKIVTLPQLRVIDSVRCKLNWRPHVGDLQTHRCKATSSQTGHIQTSINNLHLRDALVLLGKLSDLHQSFFARAVGLGKFQPAQDISTIRWGKAIKQ
jgi:hypothetical protein